MALGAPPATPFIGRVGDLERLVALFAEGQRLVTIWGAGGIGKTRLALEYAHSRHDVVFCDLAKARTHDSVCATVARVLGVPGSGNADLADTIGRALRARGEVLVLLDNFEQVAEWAEGTAGRWVTVATSARLLVTSRERLRLKSEVAYELAPLTLPTGDSGPDSDAVRLFVAFALSSGHAVDPSGPDRDLVFELVRRLEGIPLVMELAAARIGVLGVGGLLDRLGDRLDILGGTHRDSSDRQATLRRAIEWSWDLLDEDERRALAACSAFVGGFTATDATAVIDPAPGSRGPLDLLQSLRDKSLLRVDPVPGGREPRLSLFESVRDLAKERLALRGEEQARRRHAEHYLRLASEADAAGDLDALAAEWENVVTAIEHELARESGDGTDAWAGAVRALLAIERVLATRGPADVLAALLDRALSVAPAPPAGPALRARLHATRGRMLQMRGARDDARQALESAALWARDAGDRRAEADAFTDLGVLHHHDRAFDRARECYERALDLCGRGADAAPGRILANLAALLHDLRQFESAREHYADALEALASVGDPRLEGITLTNLAVLEHEDGEIAVARESYERALDLLARAGDRRLEAIALGNLGVLEHERGDVEAALQAHRRARSALRAAGDVRSESLATARLAAATAVRGDVDGATLLLDEAACLADDADDSLARAFARLARAFIDLALAARADDGGDERRAAEHLASARERIAEAHVPARGSGRSPAELSDDVRASLRLLTTAAGRLGATAARTPSPGALYVSSDGSRFRSPGADWTDLGKHPVLRRLVAALVEQRRLAPGRGLKVEALVRSAWPGERMSADAAANRVYVAISKLRRMGLGDRLVRGEDGYFLDPERPVERSDAAD